jgi:FtsH-binding integral membrane protein
MKTVFGGLVAGLLSEGILFWVGFKLPRQGNDVGKALVVPAIAFVLILIYLFVTKRSSQVISGFVVGTIISVVLAFLYVLGLGAA